MKENNDQREEQCKARTAKRNNKDVFLFIRVVSSTKYTASGYGESTNAVRLVQKFFCFFRIANVPKYGM